MHLSDYNLSLVLYLRYRTPSTPDIPVEHPEPGVLSTALKAIVSTVVITVVPVSLAFLWYNKNPRYDEDDPWWLGNYVAVYIFGLGFWNCLLIPANIAFVALQFIYEMQTIRELRTHDALSLDAVLMQAVGFLALTVAQTLRSWKGIHWFAGSWSSFGRFLEDLLAFYGTVNTHVAYFLVGVGYLTLFIVDLLEELEDWNIAARRIRRSRIRL